ncbi:hypothetical protein K1719_037001 [Acacia pycnantha]|nr:hypothetical protein K1719_037001 [Acacia pycnantha]
MLVLDELHLLAEEGIQTNLRIQEVGVRTSDEAFYVIFQLSGSPRLGVSVPSVGSQTKLYPIQLKSYCPVLSEELRVFSIMSELCITVAAEYPLSCPLYLFLTLSVLQASIWLLENCCLITKVGAPTTLDEAVIEIRNLADMSIPSPYY